MSFFLKLKKAISEKRLLKTLKNKFYPYFKGFILDQAQYIPEWIIFWLRENYLNKSSQISTHKKIFIDRSESIFKHCQIINYQETIDFLKEKI